MRALTYGSKRFPVSSMFLMQANYVFAFAKHRGQGLIYLSKAEQRDPAIDDQFTIFYYRKQNEVRQRGCCVVKLVPFVDFHFLCSVHSFSALCLT
jgi:hypothetical protein